MRIEQSLKLKAESLLIRYSKLGRGRSLFRFLHSAFCFKLFTFSFLLFAFVSHVRLRLKKIRMRDTWEVTISGKVGFPQQGQITIQEIKNGALGWSDTVKLKSNYTFSKKIKISQPGYYKITFFNRQYVDFILFKSNIEINVDGNDPNGFAEIKGSPEIDIIRKTQTILRDVESSPEMAKLSQEFSEAAQ